MATSPYISPTSPLANIPRHDKMYKIASVLVLATAVLAAPAPESKRDKRGFLHGGLALSSYDHGLSLDAYDSFHGGYHFDHAPIISAPKYVSFNKVVEVPRVVEVKKIVSVPKVVSVPHVVKVAKVIEEPHLSYAPSYSSAGWW